VVLGHDRPHVHAGCHELDDIENGRRTARCVRLEQGEHLAQRSEAGGKCCWDIGHRGLHQVAHDLAVAGRERSIEADDEFVADEPLDGLEQHGRQHDHACDSAVAVVVDLYEPNRRDRISDLIFSILTLVAYLSSICRLYPGDLIFTGTPSGVGLAQGRFLAPQDEVRSGAEVIGELRNQCVDGVGLSWYGLRAARESVEFAS